MNGSRACLFRSVVIHLACLTLLCEVWVSSVNCQTSQNECRIKALVGDVKLQKQGKTQWIDCNINMAVKEHDIIRTFVESEATLETSDNHLLTLRENCTVEIAGLIMSGQTSKTAVKIRSGDVLATIKKLTNAQSKFEFETPTAVAAIRGTKLELSVGKAVTSIKVYEGVVVVSVKGTKKSVDLLSGQMTTVKKGQETITVEQFEDKKQPEKGSDSTETQGAISDSSQIQEAMASDSSKDSTSAYPPQVQIDSAMLKKSESGSENSKSNITKIQSSTTDTSELESLKSPAHPQSARLQSSSSNPASTFTLMINEPVHGTEVTKPVVRVSGMTSPSASVIVNGMNVSVTSNGSFVKDVPLPDEEGDVTIDIEASFGDKTASASRTVRFKRPVDNIILIVQAPQERQLIHEQKLAVRGSVAPASITSISVNGTDIPVRGGLFNDYIQIPLEQGQQTIEFFVQSNSKTQTIKRTVLYDPSEKFCNTDPPSVQPSYFPSTVKSDRLSFLVTDKTIHDEVTVISSCDNSTESDMVHPTAAYAMKLEEGIHKYELYCRDKAGNYSAKIVGTIGYLAKQPSIQMVNPTAANTVLYLPPPAPNQQFQPEFGISFTVSNLPLDNPKLLKEVRVTNGTNGSVWSVKSFTNDIMFNADVKLNRGVNRIVIEVKDINDRTVTKEFVITIR